MKKVLTIVILLVMVVIGNAYADDWVFSSGEKSGQTLIKVGPGNFHGILIATDSGNPIILSVLDSATVSGKKLIPTIAITTSVTDRFKHISFPVPLKFNVGLFISALTSGTTGYSVFYK